MLTRTDRTSSEEKGISALNPAVGTTLASCLCLGLTLFLLASTIVLALIPIYIWTSTTPRTSSSSQSKPTSLLIPVQQSSSGRKRAVDDFIGYLGNQFGPTGNAQVRQTLLQYLPSNYASDITINSCTFVKLGSKRGLNKRQSVQVYLNCQIYVIYAASCLASCQTLHASAIKSSLYSGSSALNLSGIPIFATNGTQVGTLSRILAVGNPIVPDILPGSSGSGQVSTPSYATATTVTVNSLNLTTPSIG